MTSFFSFSLKFTNNYTLIFFLNPDIILIKNKKIYGKVIEILTGYKLSLQASFHTFHIGVLILNLIENARRGEKVSGYTLKHLLLHT